MTFLMYTLHVLICFFLIAVVLLQQGKGADLSVFGGGGTQTAFGARGAATVLHKMTVGSFIGFILTTLAIGVLQTRNQESQVLSTLPEAEQSVPAETEAVEETGALPTDTPVEDEAVADDAATAEGDDTAAAPADETAGDETPSDDEAATEPATDEGSEDDGAAESSDDEAGN